eukprot:CAMPEP_0194504558 /NCGR_PEP_ID=MMETSP0253-20130528/29014_1 /TAXON_ID=2966 /ORGANISM="Noctiluca scintillans" /LENGTH=414 /DNA_ID=CAMNT_0039346967 /DNA_START=77 /DNA_END=1321 /DNA_ORIENTATION=-
MAKKGSATSRVGFRKVVKAKTCSKIVAAAPVPIKIRLGILTGKNFDPVPRGTHDRNYPEKFKFLNNTGPNASGWGGAYHIDVSTGLKIARLHPDIFEIDLITGKDVTPARLSKNHLNLNFWYEVGVALSSGDKKHAKMVMKAMKDPKCRHWPAYDYYDWVMCKPNYMKQCIKAGIPMIDTIFVDNGLDPKLVLRKIKAKGWDKFFIKGAHFSFFGNGAIHGKTQDFLNDMTPLLQFAKENKDMKQFLVQPYELKPNGEVFDEVRNFFIDGEWAYSVFTHGTDYEGVWEQPDGPVKEATKALAQRAYAEVRKVAKWHGKPIKTLLNRIDIGVVPDDSKTGFRVFLNEIELEMTTWLARYCPFSLCDRMATAAVNKSRVLLKGLFDVGQKVPNAAKVKKTLEILDDRLGPLPSKTV